MKSAVLALLLIAGQAHAECQPLAPLLKATVEGGFKTRPMTPAEFHFLEGLWVLHPSTPEGLPPGDGALLAFKTGSPSAVVIVTMRGKQACGVLPIPKKVVDYLAQLRDGPGETL